MSNPNKKKTSPKELLVRIVCLILAGLMILSVAYIAISFIIDVSAEENVASYGFASAGKDRANGYYVAVALRWGSSAAVSYDITSPHGFAVGEANVTKTARGFTPVYLLDETEIVVASDANLSIGYKSCSLAASAAKTDIGAYHVELVLSSGVAGDVWDTVDDLKSMYSAEYEHVFPAYIDGVHSVRIGAFATYTDASNAAAAVGAVASCTPSAAAPECCTMKSPGSAAPRSSSTNPCAAVSVFPHRQQPQTAASPANITSLVTVR
ncbi:MAG: hypothetical protein MJ137_05370 [Clostridia bacterium]|nr:hypothetical protein [Clostridia bacterium]